MRQADWGRVMNRPGFDAHHILSGLKVRVMPSKYDSELRSKAVRLVVEHRDDYPGEFGALAAAGFPDSDPQDAEYFLLFDTAYGRVSSRALPLLKFSDEPADDFTVDGISVDDVPHGSSYVAPSNFFDRLFARTDSGG
jgi:hypothetical protein